MKKNIIFLILCVVLGLSGCYSSSEQTVISETSERQSTAVVENPELVMVGRKSPSYLYTTGISTQNGYYEYFLWDPQMYENESESMYVHIANLTYTDYETGKKTFLCNVPGCQHNNEGCTSFIKYPRGLELFTNTTETEIFILALGAYDGEALSDEDLARIYKMDLNGSNRKEIYKLPANESFNTLDIIFADNENIYVTVLITQDANNEPKKELRKINTVTGQAETIIELKNNQMIVGVYDDIVVITDTEGYTNMMQNPDLSGNKLESNFEAEENAPTGIVSYGYSISTGTYEKLYDWTTQSGVVAGNYHFAVSRTSEDIANLIVVDFLTGEKRVIDNIPAYTDANIVLTDFYNNKIMWQYFSRPDLTNIQSDSKTTVVEDEKNYCYIIDIGNDSIAELTLKANEGTANERGVYIVAETGTFFLVNIGIDYNANITLSDRDGITNTYAYTGNIRALIDKDDYYNNIPNYRIIEDLI